MLSPTCDARNDNIAVNDEVIHEVLVCLLLTKSQIKSAEPVAKSFVRL